MPLTKTSGAVVSMTDPAIPQPNTFIIGAMKAGTSALHVRLGQHPDIFMASFKEPAYFLGPITRSPGSPPKLSDVYRNDIHRYLALFSDGRGKPVIGESTTDYTKFPKFPGVAERINQCAPGARLIYLLRDPIERTISHYWWDVEHEGESRDIFTAISQDPIFGHVSHYAMQLEEYLKHFSFEQIRIVTTEEFASHPDRALAALFQWLGVDPSQPIPGSRERVNETAQVIRQTRSSFLQRTRSSRLGTAFTKLTRKGLRNFARRFAEKEIDRASVKLDDVVALLRPIQQRETEHLSDIVGRRFPEWTTLNGTNRTT